jgi:hypothetical protein
MTSDDVDASGTILAQDVCGRVQTPRARREALLEEFGRSGMTATAFAAHVGVKYQTFAAWRRARRLASAEAPSRDVMPSFVEVVTAGQPKAKGAPLVVRLPGGAVAEVHERAAAEWVAILLARMEGVVRC